MSMVYNAQIRAAFVASLEERGINVPAAEKYVSFGNDYGSAYSDASSSDAVRQAISDWARELIDAAARDRQNRLSQANIEELDRAYSERGLPGEPEWFLIFSE